MKHFKNLSELCPFNGFPLPENPLFGVYRCQGACTLGDREFTCDFYMIALKKMISGVVLYGKTKYDHESGSMMFFKPRQVIEMKNLHLEEDSFLIFIHEDYLNGHILHNEIKKYHYFDYEINESLHLSPKEELLTWDLFNKIENEYNTNQDEYSRELILAYVNTMLKYAQRFYKRQLLTAQNCQEKQLPGLTKKLKSMWKTAC